MTNKYRMLVRPQDEIRYLEDIERLREAMHEEGYDASDYDIQWAYSEWSENTYGASWMSLYCVNIEKAAQGVINELYEA